MTLSTLNIRSMNSIRPWDETSVYSINGALAFQSHGMRYVVYGALIERESFNERTGKWEFRSRSAARQAQFKAAIDGIRRELAYP